MDMRPLKTYLNESLLDDEDDLIEDDVYVTTEDFIKNNYNIRGTYTFKNGVVDVQGDIEAKNLKLTRLTNGDFKFGKVSGKFSCWKCTELETLEGGPYEVGNEFNCSVCEKLESLKGAPQNACRSFRCVNCKNLKTLEGAPQKVTNFNCGYCGKLKNLSGGPRSSENMFECYHCKNLESLEGAPDSGYVMCFNCEYCGKLKNLNGLSGKIDGLYLDKCKKLESLRSLDDLKIDAVYARGCDKLNVKYLQNHPDIGYIVTQ